MNNFLLFYFIMHNGSINIFANLGTGFNNTVTSVKSLSTGKIAVSGDFTSFNGNASSRMAILNADGTRDETFGITTGFNNSINSFGETPEGKIVAVGNFTSYNDTAINRIARLNADGSLDADFSIGTGSPSTISSLAVQNDGKVILGGSFASFNGVAASRIVRLNTDGSVDDSFNAGTGANFPVLVMAVQPDGKILIGGNFTTYNGTSVTRIARLNADGTLDTTFSTGTGLNTTPLAFIVQPDGKIILIGDFATYNGTAVSRIFRINADGAYDGLFSIGSGANGTIRTAAFQEEQKLIIGGGFNNFGGTGKNRFARLLFSESSLAAASSESISRQVTLYPNPAQNVIHIKGDKKAGESSIYDISGRKVMEFRGNSANIETLKSGVYFIRILSEDGSVNQIKFIKN